MKKLSLALASVSLLLVACTKPAAEPRSMRFEDYLRNPLFAERYWTELTDRMVTLHLNNDPVLKDDAKAKAADRIRVMALERSQEETKKRNTGLYGAFLMATEQTDGDVLLSGNMLYLGTTFTAYPGGQLHLYLTEVVDPRDFTFPDPTAIDLGELESPYGAQEYVIDRPAEELKKIRTVVLWDEALGRLLSFAQLSTLVLPVPDEKMQPETSSAASSEDSSPEASSSSVTAE